MDEPQNAVGLTAQSGSADEPGAAGDPVHLGGAVDPGLFGGLAGDGWLLARMLDFLDAGGPVVMILLVCWVVALSIVLAKLWQFRALRVGERRRAPQAIALLRRGRDDEALSLLANSPSPVAQVVARAIRGRQRRALSESLVREEVLRSGNEAIEGLRSLGPTARRVSGLAPRMALPNRAAAAATPAAWSTMPRASMPGWRSTRNIRAAPACAVRKVRPRCSL